MPEISMRIIELINKNGPISITDVEEILKVNKFTLRDHIKRLVREGYLIRLGRGRATKYTLSPP